MTTYRYTAYTAQQDGTTNTAETVEAAIHAAKGYAKEAFPAWQYAGHGPTIKVADEFGRIVHEERL